MMGGKQTGESAVCLMCMVATEFTAYATHDACSSHLILAELQSLLPLLALIHLIYIGLEGLRVGLCMNGGNVISSQST